MRDSSALLAAGEASEDVAAEDTSRDRVPDVSISDDQKEEAPDRTPMAGEPPNSPA